jgi:hypothetical protein
MREPATIVAGADFGATNVAGGASNIYCVAR